MKTNSHRPFTARSRSRSGFATLIVIALLGLMVAVIETNSRTLHALHREIMVIEQKQIKRAATAVPTNAAPTVDRQTR